MKTELKQALRYWNVSTNFDKIGVIFEDMKKCTQSLKWHIEGAVFTDGEQEIIVNKDNLNILRENINKYNLISNGTVYDHTLLVLDKMKSFIELNKDKLNDKEKSILIVAAILHDIGKPYCNQGELQHDVDINGKVFPESVPCVYDHPLVGADMGFELLLEWGLPEDDANLIRRMIKYHMRMHQIENIKKVYKLQVMVEKEHWPYLVVLSYCDENGCISVQEGAYKGILNILKQRQQEIPTALDFFKERDINFV